METFCQPKIYQTILFTLIYGLNYKKCSCTLVFGNSYALCKEKHFYNYFTEIRDLYTHVMSPSSGRVKWSEI